MLTQKQAFKACREMGYVAKKTEGGDYRLCKKGAPEEQAYYTDCLEDLVDTCKNDLQREQQKVMRTPSQRFDCSVDEWEDRAFLDAVYFTTFRLHSGRHKRDTRRFDTFKQAIDDARPDPRALVYAVTAAGRQVCLDRAKWDHYSDLLASKLTA